MTLQLRHIVMPLSDFTLELDVELCSQVTAIFGPSGAGKTSLLDLVAGLRTAKSAFIRLDDLLLSDPKRKVNVPSARRRIGYVPQDLALFPHLNVRQNLTYGYRDHSAEETRFTLAHVAQVMEIEPLLERAVTHLSGGEQQRVSLARALLISPRLLLLDEPLASLDAALKSKLRPYLQRIRSEFRLPMLYVSHDPDEVAEICDEVLVLRRGKCVERGAPADVFQSEPSVRFVLRSERNQGSSRSA